MLTPIQSRGFSLARGFIVFVMPAVHSVMLYSSEEVKQGWLGSILGFLAEGPGAQLFMFLMGVFIVLGRRKTMKQILIRCLLIGGLGYLLNLFRLVVPYYFNLLPENYISSLVISPDSSVAWQLFMIGDILQFASLAYFFGALLHKFFPRFIFLILITSVVWWISPYTWDFNTVSNFSILHLFTGVPPQVFFPVFPWLFFPMLGLVFGRLLQLYTPTRFLKAMILTGILLFVLGKLMTITEPVEWNANFYRQGRGGTLFHAGVALLWTALFIGIAQLKTSNLFFRLLDFVSRHITIIYVLQWIIIMWMFRLFGYNRLTLAPSLFALLVTSILSFSLAWLFIKRPSSKKHSYEI
jgi:hypothetical protein